MNSNVFYRRRAERFAQLLDEANGGPRHHARVRPDDQLTELVAVGRQLSASRPTVELDGDFRAGLRAMLVATAEREGIGITDPAGEAAPERTIGPVSHARTAGTTARRLRARGAVVLGVAVGAMAVSGISTASENAVPGDMLYGVKRSTERAQLALASSDYQRGQLFLGFARSRLAEAGTVPGAGAGLVKVFTDMDADTRQGVRLLATSAVQRNDEAALNAIDTFVTRQRRQVGTLLPGLSGENRERALQSMMLLDDVDRRARGLRSALTCDTGPGSTLAAERGTTDALGPQPRACAPASRPAVVEGPAPRQPGRQRDITVPEPLSSPDTGRAVPTRAPGPRVAVTPSATPSPAEASAAADEPTLIPLPTPTLIKNGRVPVDSGRLDGVVPD